MKGRKPIPTRLHQLRGNPGKRLHDADSEMRPGVVYDLPAPPAHLNRRAAARWRQVTRELVEIHMLTKVDLPSLAAYCSACARYAEAEELLNSGSLVVSSNRGSRANPLVKIANDAMKLMNQLAAEFGLTPSSRSRVKAADAPKQDEFQGFLDERKEHDSKSDDAPNRNDLN